MIEFSIKIHRSLHTNCKSYIINYSIAHPLNVAVVNMPTFFGIRSISAYVIMFHGYNPIAALRIITGFPDVFLHCFDHVSI